MKLLLALTFALSASAQTYGWEHIGGTVHMVLTFQDPEKQVATLCPAGCPGVYATTNQKGVMVLLRSDAPEVTAFRVLIRYHQQGHNRTVRLEVSLDSLKWGNGMAWLGTEPFTITEVTVEEIRGPVSFEFADNGSGP